jgi:nucleoside-diphosphate-sugar epimerase
VEARGAQAVNVDEDAPLRPDSPALYSSSKAKAEGLVRAANDSALETVVVRPRFVWGKGDTTLLPALVELVRECTLDISRARAETGYEPRTTRAQGLAELAENR